MMKRETFKGKKHHRVTRFVRKVVPDTEERILECQYDTDFKKYSRKRTRADKIENDAKKNQDS